MTTFPSFDTSKPRSRGFCFDQTLDALRACDNSEEKPPNPLPPRISGLLLLQEHKQMISKDNKAKEKKLRQQMREVSRMHWENHERQRRENKQKTRKLMKVWMDKKLEQLEYQTETRDAELREREHRHRQALSKGRKLRVVAHVHALRDERVTRKMHLKNCYAKHKKKYLSLKAKEELAHQSAAFIKEHVKEQAAAQRDSIQWMSDQVEKLKHIQDVEIHRQRSKNKLIKKLAEDEARDEVLDHLYQKRLIASQLQALQKSIEVSEGARRRRIFQKEAIERIRYKKLLHNAFGGMWVDIRSLKSSQEEVSRSSAKAFQSVLQSSISKQKQDVRLREQTERARRKQLLIQQKAASNKQQREAIKAALAEASQSRPVNESRREHYLAELKSRHARDSPNTNWDEVLSANYENNSLQEYNELSHIDLPS